MAELHHGATITPTKRELIERWMGTQRWYAAKGHAPSTRRLHAFRFDDPHGQVGIETMIVADGAGTGTVVYQVPLTYRDAPVAGLEHALVGTMDHSVLGPRWVYDGCHDPAYAAQLLAVIQGRARVASASTSDAFDEAFTGSAHHLWPALMTFRGCKVLSGEQSNTSIIIDATTADGESKPLMVKVFRTLQAGHNPDVELQGALMEAGCDRVPATVGHLSGRWAGPAGEEVAGDLALAQEFLPGVEDAWRVAVRAIASGTDFTDSARALGEATAEVHRALAASLGTTPTTPELAQTVVAQMRSRAAVAETEAPALAAYEQQIAALLAAAQDADWPAMQRVHGDYHLGQVLHSPDRGWILLDFEGEPLRPLAQRTQPDQWIRDVAGMMRSFDYAGGSAEHARPGISARAWVTATQEAFLDGYAARSGTDPRSSPTLLTAFQLDKAVYEVVYEARNRPTWLSIPLDAVQRLLAAAAAGAHSQEVRP
ncbi:MAG: phosphotransferase [Nostocoides sp.]